MTSLPPYSGEYPPCTKCGHRGARTDWHERTDSRPEYLDRRCANCGYGWCEATVEQQLPVHVGGNAEDCPACDTSNGMPYPFICPGP